MLFKTVWVQHFEEEMAKMTVLKIKRKNFMVISAVVVSDFHLSVDSVGLLRHYTSTP